VERLSYAVLLFPNMLAANCYLAIRSITDQHNVAPFHLFTFLYKSDDTVGAHARLCLCLHMYTFAHVHPQIAYSPLALGLLSGKYGPGHLPSGPRKALAAPLFAAPAKSSKTTISAADGLGTGAIGATVGNLWCWSQVHGSLFL